MDTLKLNFCKIHKNERYKYLKINQIAENKGVFFCEYCYKYDDCQVSNYISLKQILKSDENSIILSWPPLDQSDLFYQICRIKDQSLKKQCQLSEQIEYYFNTLEKDILHQLNICKKSQMNKVESLIKMEQQVLERYEDIAKINQLKKILIDNSISLEQKEQSLLKIIKQQILNQAQNSQQIRDSLKECFDIQKETSIKNNTIIQEQIIQMIGQINFFTEQSNEEITKNQIDAILEKGKLQKQKGTEFTNQAFEYQKIDFGLVKQDENKENYLNIEQQNKLIKEQQNIIIQSIEQMQQLLEKSNQYLLREQLINKERLEIKRNDILSTFEFILSRFENGDNNNYLTFSKDNQKNHVKIKSSGKSQGDYYSNQILKRNSLYIFNIEILSQVDKYSLIEVGLVRDTVKESQYCYEDQLAFSLIYDETSNQYQFTQNMNQIESTIIGDFVIKKIDLQLEIKICIDQGLLEITNNSNNNINKFNISGKNQELIRDYQDLRFFIGFYGDIEISLISAYEEELN